MSSVYYNEWEKYPAAWLRNLVDKNHIRKGVVDETDIRQIKAEEIADKKVCHFFAGIGGWEYALQLAGWPEDRPVWTGSCPCQPFSVAGAGKGKADDRHLWPHFFKLIQFCHPPTIFAEQVRGAITHGWLDEVSRDLEAEGYAVGAAVLPACGVGAPHRRERLWIVADAGGAGRRERLLRHGGNNGESFGEGWSVESPESGETPSPLANTNNAGSQGRYGGELQERSGEQFVGPGGSSMANTESERRGKEGQHSQRSPKRPSIGGDVSNTESVGRKPRSENCGRRPEGSGAQQGPGFREHSSERSASFWEPESSICKLSHGVPARVGRLRAYGNAIVPQLAAAFIRAFLEAEKEL